MKNQSSTHWSKDDSKSVIKLKAGSKSAFQETIVIASF